MFVNNCLFYSCPKGQVQGYFRLGNQDIPLDKGVFWVAGGKTGAKVVFPGLDGALGEIAAVDMWRH